MLPSDPVPVPVPVSVPGERETNRRWREGTEAGGQLRELEGEATAVVVVVDAAVAVVAAAER